ncbi:ROK family protein [Candidatus Saccharibacteria bacterium]|nr:ROK family protein [Candidatus Saccharibacteria bacterium]
MIVAVDTGGTKTLVSSFGKDGKLGEQFKFPTPKEPTEYLKQLRELIKQKYHDQSIDAVVIASPGVSKNGVVLWGGGNLKWENVDIKSRLAGVLGNTPVYVENDANLAGLGETRFLSKIPAQSLYVTISTGIGDGIITEGHINEDLRNSESGHALVEYDGVVREWETFASGKAIYKTYGQYAHDITSKKTWNQIADRISRGFLVVIPILQPDVIIIGGSIGTYFEKFSDQLQAILAEKLPNHIPCPKFIKAKYPELAVIYGCYYYALDKLADKSS